jgi:hypothetical protein
VRPEGGNLKKINAGVKGRKRESSVGPIPVVPLFDSENDSEGALVMYPEVHPHMARFTIRSALRKQRKQS